MTYRIEPGVAPHDTRYVNHCNLIDTAETLTEVSVAALTTDPELRDFGRALICLVRYHAERTTSARGSGDPRERASA